MDARDKRGHDDEVANSAKMRTAEGRERYRLRAGSYRVIFAEDATTILAIYIGRLTCPKPVGSQVRRAMLYIIGRYILGGVAMKTAKIFRSGRSQAVRLPKEFRFEGDKVRLRRLGSAVVLEPLATNWDWLDEIAGQLDEDFVRAVNDQRGSKNVQRSIDCSPDARTIF